ncbi:MAG: hypothetical protein LBT05_00125 [Planctomycetaceae bacterium]|nr:hypothetical protein [Planctomycetaceae bacterium]
MEYYGQKQELPEIIREIQMHHITGGSSLADIEIALNKRKTTTVGIYEPPHVGKMKKVSLDLFYNVKDVIKAI